jgi:hypothetical protein
MYRGRRKYAGRVAARQSGFLIGPNEVAFAHEERTTDARMVRGE